MPKGPPTLDKRVSVSKGNGGAIDICPIDAWLALAQIPVSP